MKSGGFSGKRGVTKSMRWWFSCHHQYASRIRDKYGSTQGGETMSFDVRWSELVGGLRASQINRRSMLRLMGLGGLGLLAACSSKSSTGSNETAESTTSSSNTGGTTATSASGIATPGSGSPVAA